MRSSSLVITAVAILVSAKGFAQSSSEETIRQLPCCSPLYDAPVRAPADDSFRSVPRTLKLVDRTSVVTAEDMRELGIISAADLVKQLPQEVSEKVPANPRKAADKKAETVGEDEQHDTSDEPKKAPAEE